jgi:FeS assembly SUF system regulator
MIKVTKLTDYGVVLMTRLARSGSEKVYTAPELAEELQLPLPTVRKILKTLTRENLLVSQRGAAGGYNLARDPDDITLMDMVVALEGPVALTECSTGDPCACERQTVCDLQENWNLVNHLFRNTLESYTLKQMAGTLPGARPTIHKLQGLN